eukprot:1192856-Prorocentrum_minimum.AAC.2
MRGFLQQMRAVVSNNRRASSRAPGSARSRTSRAPKNSGAEKRLLQARQFQSDSFMRRRCARLTKKPTPMGSFV